MRKLLTLAFALALALCTCVFAGCSDEPKEPTNDDPPPEEIAAVTYWVVETFTLEGTEFTTEEIESIFGPLESVISLAVNADKTLEWVLFGDFVQCPYEGDATSFTFDLGNDQGTGQLTEDGHLQLTMADGSIYLLAQQDEKPAALAANPWSTYDVSFSAEETTAMSNFMSGGDYLIDGNTLYGLTHAVTLDGSLGATPFEMVGDFPEFGDVNVIDENGMAHYLTKDGEWLYYILDYFEIYRIHPDGSGREMLYEGTCDYLQIHEGKLYFTDEDFHFVSCNLDGSGLETVIDRAVFYPYFIASDWLIFQDDADDESLHLLNTTHGTDVNITWIPSYHPIIDGSYLYYTEIADDGVYLSRIDMSDPERFPYEGGEGVLLEALYAIDEASIYTTNGVCIPKEDWMYLSDVSEGIEEWTCYVSPEYTVYHYFDEEGYISGKYLMSKERHGGTSFM